MGDEFQRQVPRGYIIRDYFIATPCIVVYRVIDPQKQRFSSFKNNTGRTYEQTDRRLDTTSYRNVRSHLKRDPYVVMKKWGGEEINDDSNLNCKKW